MPDFDKDFFSKDIVEFKGNSLLRFDTIPFKDGDQFLIIFEKTNSEWRQGIGLNVFGEFEVNGKRFPDRTVLWEDTAPKKAIITVFEEKGKRKHRKHPPKGMLGVKNIWDIGDGTIHSWLGGAAMIVEEIENGKRYRCNDAHTDENFDDIIFTIQKMQ